MHKTEDRRSRRRSCLNMLPITLAYLVISGNLVVGVTVPIPLAPPSTAPLVVPPLVSFSIEQDRWTDWVGTTSRNQFFFNTLNNLNQISGVPPRVRIGANSEDHTNFNPAVGVNPKHSLEYVKILNRLVVVLRSHFPCDHPHCSIPGSK